MSHSNIYTVPDSYPLFRPLLHRLDPERAHELTLQALELGLGPRQTPPLDARLQTQILGRTLAHPLGLAAGFDKNARAVPALFALGFSHVEVGGVTPLPQAGNPRPRVFRLSEDDAVINRMGFPNQGAQKVAARLAKRRLWPGLLGVNIASNAASDDPIADFVGLSQCFAPLADFLTLDISCPNTINGRIFLQPKRLRELLGALDATDFGPGPRPHFVAKLSPDIADAELGRIVEVLEFSRISAFCVGNTTLSRPPGLRGPAAEVGGLSGRPLHQLSTKMVQTVHRLVENRIPIIGTGGISSGADAYAKICAGATSLQLYTALIYQGPNVILQILSELSALLERDGFASLAAAIGSAADRS